MNVGEIFQGAYEQNKLHDNFRQSTPVSRLFFIGIRYLQMSMIPSHDDVCDSRPETMWLKIRCGACHSHVCIKKTSKRIL